MCRNSGGVEYMGIIKVTKEESGEIRGDETKYGLRGWSK